MNTKGLIPAATFSLLLVLIALEYCYYPVWAEPSSTTITSTVNETRVNTKIDANATLKNKTQENSNEYYPLGKSNLSSPVVMFQTEKELEDYFLHQNVTAPTFISNSTMGNVTNIQAAPSDGITYAVFQTRLNGTDHVFLTMVRDATATRGFSFSKPVELTPAQHKLTAARHSIISHLQITAVKNKAFAVWQDHNSTTGLNSIFVSSSMDSGKVFHTYQASAKNADAFDPVLASNGVLFWKQPFPPSGAAVGASATNTKGNTTYATANTNVTKGDPPDNGAVIYNSW